MKYEINKEEKTLHIQRNNPVLISNLIIYILISLGYIGYTMSTGQNISALSAVMYLLLPVVFLLMTYKVFFLEYFIKNDILEVWLFKWKVKSAPLEKVKIFVSDFTALPKESKASTAGIFTIDIDEKEYNITNMSEEEFLALKEFFDYNAIPLTPKEIIRR